jgi:hypothetical protein
VDWALSWDASDREVSEHELDGRDGVVPAGIVVSFLAPAFAGAADVNDGVEGVVADGADADPGSVGPLVAVVGAEVGAAAFEA